MYHDRDSLEGMPVIKPISDLRNKARELSTICHDSGEPIFITKNGEGDMVLMSLAAYERLQARLELYRLLDEAEADVRAGDRGVSVDAVRHRLRR
jgi:prevent-host-death family protein